MGATAASTEVSSALLSSIYSDPFLQDGKRWAALQAIVGSNDADAASRTVGAALTSAPTFIRNALRPEAFCLNGSSIGAPSYVSAAIDVLSRPLLPGDRSTVQLLLLGLNIAASQNPSLLRQLKRNSQTSDVPWVGAASDFLSSLPTGTPDFAKTLINGANGAFGTNDFSNLTAPLLSWLGIQTKSVVDPTITKVSATDIAHGVQLSDYIAQAQSYISVGATIANFFAPGNVVVPKVVEGLGAGVSIVGAISKLACGALGPLGFAMTALSALGSIGSLFGGGPDPVLQAVQQLQQQLQDFENVVNARFDQLENLASKTYSELLHLADELGSLNNKIDQMEASIEGSISLLQTSLDVLKETVQVEFRKTDWEQLIGQVSAGDSLSAYTYATVTATSPECANNDTFDADVLQHDPENPLSIVPDDAGRVDLIASRWAKMISEVCNVSIAFPNGDATLAVRNPVEWARGAQLFASLTLANRKTLSLESRMLASQRLSNLQLYGEVISSCVSAISSIPSGWDCTQAATGASEAYLNRLASSMQSLYQQFPLWVVGGDNYDQTFYSIDGSAGMVTDDAHTNYVALAISEGYIQLADSLAYPWSDYRKVLYRTSRADKTMKPFLFAGSEIYVFLRNENPYTAILVWTDSTGFMYGGQDYNGKILRGRAGYALVSLCRQLLFLDGLLSRLPAMLDNDPDYLTYIHAGSDLRAVATIARWRSVDDLNAHYDANDAGAFLLGEDVSYQSSYRNVPALVTHSEIRNWVDGFINSFDSMTSLSGPDRWPSDQSWSIIDANINITPEQFVPLDYAGTPIVSVVVNGVAARIQKDLANLRSIIECAVSTNTQSVPIVDRTLARLTLLQKMIGRTN